MPDATIPALSPEQTAVANHLLDFVLEYRKPTTTQLLDRSHYTTLGGYAGTGKTVVIRHLVDALNDQGIFPVAVMALAGKAVHVLRKKGIHWAKTIHSSIYDAELDSDGKYQFNLKSAKDLDAEAIIVDEASMVSRSLFDDLLSFGRPIVFVGDHGQLEPIGENPELMASPSLRLETIHRQALLSPIIRFAHHLREGRDATQFSERPPPDDPPVTCTAPSTELYIAKQAELQFDETFQVICGFNDLRHTVNRDFRAHFNRDDPLPLVGDCIIILRNSMKHGLFNGQMATVLARSTPRRGLIDLSFKDDAGTTFEMLPFLCAQFGSSAKDLRAPPHSPSAILADYAYAITAHKAQGSEFDKVAVIEQPSPLWSMPRWRYTAATRASTTLHYYV